MKERKIKTNLVDYALAVLNRRGIVYTLRIRDKEEYSYLITNLTSNEYHRLIERAMCEKESKEIHGGRQVISYYEWRNRLYDGRGFHILRKDSARFLSEIAC